MPPAIPRSPGCLRPCLALTIYGLKQDASLSSLFVLGRDIKNIKVAMTEGLEACAEEKSARSEEHSESTIVASSQMCSSVDLKKPVVKK